jgi:type I restriction enzyme S subunit
MTHENTHTYKLVESGDFVISLRSFQGGLEYSRYRGLVSPAYHVIRPAIALCDDYYRHYFKSSDFIQRLAIATIGIRDGKQISYGDFSFMRIPLPPLEEQRAIAAVVDTVDREIKILQAKTDALREQKKGLMQQLLTGKKRVTARAT